LGFDDDWTLISTLEINESCKRQGNCDDGLVAPLFDVFDGQVVMQKPNAQLAAFGTE
jgi:hypothetical protein